MAAINLNPEKALIFRIVHVDNVAWILDHGLHCRNSPVFDPNYRNIGNPELIDRRHTRAVPLAPGGTLSDYVPFYFTPFSIMMFNIKTGYGGVPQVPNDEIVIFVSSLRRLVELDLPFLFTDRHAYPVMARYFNSLDHLDQIAWPILQARDFKHDPDDPGKKERYQAEALVHRHLPCEALLGIGCHSAKIGEHLEKLLAAKKRSLRVTVQPNWYF